MTAKDYLEQGRSAEQRVRAREEQLQRLRERMTRVRSSIPRGLAGDRRGPRVDWTDAVDALADAEGWYVRELAQLYGMHKKLRLTIEAVPEEKHRYLLEFRYLDCMDWEEVAQRMGYERRYVYKLHEKALIAMEAVLAAMDGGMQNGE